MTPVQNLERHYRAVNCVFNALQAFIENESVVCSNRLRDHNYCEYDIAGYKYVMRAMVGKGVTRFVTYSCDLKPDDYPKYALHETNGFELKTDNGDLILLEEGGLPMSTGIAIENYIEKMITYTDNIHNRR